MWVRFIRKEYRCDSHLSTVCRLRKKINNQFNQMLSNSEKLEALDKRLLRFILNDYTSHYITLLNKIEVTSLYKRAHSEFLILFHRSLFFSQYPTYLRNICVMFAVQPIICAVPTCFLSARTTTYRLHSFSYFSAKQCNSLTDELILSDVCKVLTRFISFTNFCLRVKKGLCM